MGSTIAVVGASGWPKQPASTSVKLPALVDALEESLQAVPSEARATDKDWYAAPLVELVSHIVDVHHGYMKTALPRLRSLVPTVLKAHGAHHGDVLRQVQDLFNISGHGTQQSLDEGRASAIPLHRGR